jgi:hypothetical protein
MTTSYVLIDYENVQPKDVAALNAQPFKVFVFIGANQKTLPVNLVESLQPLGQSVEYIRMSGNGRNALDFHIAFYLGELAASDPQGDFRVISKDAGFDPLLAHLKARGIRAQRSAELGDIPGPGAATRQAFDERLAAVIDNLRSNDKNRPRRRKTLASAIQALFGKKLEASEVDRLITALASRGVTVAQDGKVTYGL